MKYKIHIMKFQDIWEWIKEFYKQSSKPCLSIFFSVYVVWFLIFFKTGAKRNIRVWKKMGLL